MQGRNKQIRILEPHSLKAGVLRILWSELASTATSWSRSLRKCRNSKLSNGMNLSIFSKICNLLEFVRSLV